MTAIDDAMSSIQQVQNDFAILTQYLQSYQSGKTNGMNIDKVSLKTSIQTLTTKIITDLQTVKTNVQSALGTL